MKDYETELRISKRYQKILDEIKKQTEERVSAKKRLYSTCDENNNSKEYDSKYDYIQGHKNPFDGKRKKLFYEYVEKYNIKFSENERIAYTQMMQSEYNRQKGHTLKLFHETPAWEIGCDLIGSFVSFLDDLA